MSRNVLVIVERRGGEVKRASLEALSVAKRLAAALGGESSALLPGSGATDAARILAPYGPARVFVADDAALDAYAPEALASVVVEAVKAAEPALVLFGGTAMGRDLSARVAARLGAPCAVDLVEIEVALGRLTGRRPMYSGKAFARVAAALDAGPIVATLRPNAFPAIPGDESPAEAVPLPAVAVSAAARAVRLEKPAEAEIDVAEASIVVSGGRGLKGPENFGVVRDLAAALGGAVGASRAVVDAGWIDHSHQVGQTGKVVSPELYVACGISGAIQHLAGMSTSKVIVAVNKDREAPIFQVATYGIVGDLFEIVPKITEEVRKLKAAG